MSDVSLTRGYRASIDNNRRFGAIDHLQEGHVLEIVSPIVVEEEAAVSLMARYTLKVTTSHLYVGDLPLILGKESIRETGILIFNLRGRRGSVGM